LLQTNKEIFSPGEIHTVCTDDKMVRWWQLSGKIYSLLLTLHSYTDDWISNANGAQNDDDS